jgi:hypothetical protein
LEFESKFSDSSLSLRQKGSNAIKIFRIFEEDRLTGIKQSAAVSKFDMSRLETEYDYETEKEQISQSVNMLRGDLRDAI